MVDLPIPCPTYYGPHSLDCLTMVWDLAGCLPEGEESPDKLSLSQVTTFSALNYRLNQIPLFFICAFFDVIVSFYF